jgi:hypothetical protein
MLNGSSGRHAMMSQGWVKELQMMNHDGHGRFPGHSCLLLGLAQRHVQNCRFPEASTASAKHGLGALKSLERGKGGKKDA